MNYSSIIEATQRNISYQVVKSIMGEWEADRWLAWADSAARTFAMQEARKLNNRGSWHRPLSKQGRSLRITDRRTRGYKHMRTVQLSWFADYEKRCPPPKEPQGSNVMMQRILGVTPS